MEEQVTTKAVPELVGVAASRSRLLALLRMPLYANALYLWTNKAGAAVVGFAFWALAARLYDTHEVGLGSATLSALILLATFSHLGFGMGLIRFLPESGAHGPRLANAVFTASAGAAVIVSAVFLVGVPLWAPNLDFLFRHPLYTVAFISFVVAATLYAVQAHTFVAIRKAKYVLVEFVFLQVSRVALIVLMAVFLGTFGIVASMGIATALAVVVGFALLTKGLPGYRPAGVIDRRSVFKLLPFSVANHAADSLLMVPVLILPLVVVGFLGAEEAAYFYMPWFVGHVVIMASHSLALSLFAEGSYQPEALLMLARRAAVGALAVAAVGALFLLLVGDKLLLVFGGEYASEGATLLRLVALAALPAAVVNIYLAALRVTKRVGELITTAAVVAVTTVALSSALLPLMGLAGAGVGLGLGQALGSTIVLSRLLTTVEGTMPQRMQRLFLTLAGRS